MVSGPSASWHGVNTGSMDVAFVPIVFDWSTISVGTVAAATLWVVNVGSVTAKDWVTGQTAETVRQSDGSSGPVGRVSTSVGSFVTLRAFINPTDAPSWPDQKPLWAVVGGLPFGSSAVFSSDSGVPLNNFGPLDKEGTFTLGVSSSDQLEVDVNVREMEFVDRDYRRVEILQSVPAEVLNQIRTAGEILDVLPVQAIVRVVVHGVPPENGSHRVTITSLDAKVLTFENHPFDSDKFVILYEGELSNETRNVLDEFILVRADSIAKAVLNGVENPPQTVAPVVLGLTGIHRILYEKAETSKGIHVTLATNEKMLLERATIKWELNAGTNWIDLLSEDETLGGKHHVFCKLFVGNENENNPGRDHRFRLIESPSNKRKDYVLRVTITPRDAGAAQEAIVRETVIRVALDSYPLQANAANGIFDFNPTGARLLGQAGCHIPTHPVDANIRATNQWLARGWIDADNNQFVFSDNQNAPAAQTPVVFDHIPANIGQQARDNLLAQVNKLLREESIKYGGELSFRGNRLQYSKKLDLNALWGGLAGLTFHKPLVPPVVAQGAFLKGIILRRPAFAHDGSNLNDGLNHFPTYDELCSLVTHEVRHLKQSHAAVVNPNGPYGTLLNWMDVNGTHPFFEVEAFVDEMRHPQASYHLFVVKRHFLYFKQFYDRCLDLLDKDPLFAPGGQLRAPALEILNKVWDDIPASWGDVKTDARDFSLDRRPPLF